MTSAASSSPRTHARPPQVDPAWTTTGRKARSGSSCRVGSRRGQLFRRGGVDIYQGRRQPVVDGHGHGTEEVAAETNRNAVARGAAVPCGRARARGAKVRGEGELFTQNKYGQRVRSRNASSVEAVWCSSGRFRESASSTANSIQENKRSLLLQTDASCASRHKQSAPFLELSLFPQRFLLVEED